MTKYFRRKYFDGIILRDIFDQNISYINTGLANGNWWTLRYRALNWPLFGDYSFSAIGGICSLSAVDGRGAFSAKTNIAYQPKTGQQR